MTKESSWEHCQMCVSAHPPYASRWYLTMHAQTRFLESNVRSAAIQSRMLFRSFLLSLCLATSLFAQDKPEWKQPFPPHRIAGNLYYVGGKDLASYLITTPEGHILINSNLESSVPQIKESVEKLGFHFKDIKILLISHAHFDHCAGSALIKQLTGAKYMVMDADVAEIEDGGHSNFRYHDSPETF